jgi:hypothetical protein
MTTRVLTFIRRCSLAVLVALVAGCASKGPSFQLAAPQAGSALLYLYRPYSDIGAGYHYLASVNGRVVARLKSGSYFAMDIPPGKVAVACKAASAFGICWPGNIEGAREGFLDTEQFEVMSGYRYFVRFPSGKLTIEADALTEIGGTELLAPL